MASPWAGIGPFPMEWTDGDVKIRVPSSPSITDDGFRLYGVRAWKAGVELDVHYDLGWHNPPWMVADPEGPVVASRLERPDGSVLEVRVREDPLAAFKFHVRDVVRTFE